MSETGDLERRVRRLEQEVPQLRGEVAEVRTEATAARFLAGGADRDVSEVRAELRAHTSALNALREGQRELWDGQREQGVRIDSLEREMRTGFATVNAGVSQIITLLDSNPRPNPE
jgi:chromosome segregation ATPase